jgi:hypothetical protein
MLTAVLGTSVGCKASGTVSDAGRGMQAAQESKPIKTRDCKMYRPVNLVWIMDALLTVEIAGFHLHGLYRQCKFRFFARIDFLG